MRKMTARYLGAFRVAFRTLEDYYTQEVFSPTLSDPRFPWYRDYTDLDTQTERRISYTSQVDDKLVFFASVGNRKVCVKFPNSYSQEAHIKAFELGVAPKLLGFRPIPSDWFIVVMERLEKPYTTLRDAIQLDPEILETLRPRISQKLSLLHQAGLVHGDVRSTNIMVRPDTLEFKFIDFDWAGEIGQVVYPMNLNNADIPRPQGVEDGQLVLAEHDIQMVDLL